MWAVSVLGSMSKFSFECITFEEYFKHLKGNSRQLVARLGLKICIEEYLAFIWYTKAWTGDFNLFDTAG